MDEGLTLRHLQTAARSPEVRSSTFGNKSGQNEFPPPGVLVQPEALITLRYGRLETRWPSSCSPYISLKSAAWGSCAISAL